MSLREYFCSNGIFHLEELKPFHSQQRLLRVLEIEQEASFWLTREHLRVRDGTGPCLLRRRQHWTEGLKTDSMKAVRGTPTTVGALVYFLAILKTLASHRQSGSFVA